MNFDDLTLQLNNMLGDTSNFALSLAQKQQNLTTAFQDQYVVSEVWDNSITFSVTNYQYPVPTDMDVVIDIWLERAQDRFPEPISTSLWNQIAGNIQFLPSAQWKIPDNYSLWVQGTHKNIVSDDITDVAAQNYILSLAGLLCLRNLAYTKLLSFLRNDTTVADIINLRKDMENEVAAYRAQLQTRWISS